MDKNLFHDISYGMYVVSTKYKNRNVGCIINTFSQITSEDMIVMISLNKQNYTNQAIKATKRFAISIISEETTADVIGKFGFFTSKDTDKFSSFKYRVVEDLPIIEENTCGYFICDVVKIVDSGTHDVVLAKVKDAKKINENKPMTYSYYHKVVKGKAPKTAPTYIEEEIEKIESKKYQCTVCGYIYDESREEKPFENLPEDWKCPLCGVKKEMFKEIK